MDACIRIRSSSSAGTLCLSTWIIFGCSHEGVDEILFAVERSAWVQETLHPATESM
jgi:hypothetical protein